MATETLNSDILAAYPLREPVIVRRFEATRNEIWLIEESRGQRYVLRRNLQHANAERIEFQVRFQQHLLKHGFPTSEIVEARSGESVVVDGRGVPWVLFTFVQGDEFDFARDEQVLEAARRLAQFHSIAETFPGTSVSLDYQGPYRDWWAGAEENLHDLEEMYAGLPVQDELSYVREWWARVLTEWPLARLDALPVGWVYGDYHGRNMVFVGNELRGLFDFDDIERGPLIYDVAQGVHMFAREKRGSHTIRTGVARAFIVAYAPSRTLSDEERAALLMMVAMSFPPNAAYHRYCREKRGEDLVARLRREVVRMRWLRAEMERIGPELQHA